MSSVGIGSGRVWMRDWLVNREKREEEGKWPLKLRDRPSVILISVVIEGGSHVGSAKTSKALADLPPSVAKSMVVLALLEDSWSAAAHNTKKLSKRDRARGIMGFIVTVECVCVSEVVECEDDDDDIFEEVGFWWRKR